MNDKPNDQHPATDDQELAKVLAGVDEQVSQLPADQGDSAAPAGGLQFEETPLATPASDTSATDTATAETAPAPAADDASTAVVPADEAAAEPTDTPEPAETAAAEPVLTPAPAAPANVSPELESIKKNALEELRPLVTKLDLPADEKFDTMLLIIRSTDDQSLVAPAHEAAQQITDEKKRAEALLDIIKEIDYFGNQHAA